LNILILTERFHPETNAPAVRLLDHARIWVREGHQVTVVTSVPNAPNGVVPDGYRNRWWQEEDMEGVRVIRLWSYVAPNTGYVRRVLDWVSLAVTTVLAAPWLPKVDVIIGSSPPIFSPVAAVCLSVLKRTPWVMEVRDLWPASIRAVGAMDGPVIRILEWLELGLSRRARHVIVVTEAFRADLMARGVPEAKIDVVRNAVDLKVFHPDVVAMPRAELGVPEEGLLVGYIGTTGMAHGLETLIEAAEILQPRSDIHVLILGEGARRTALERDAVERSLTNLTFHDYVPHDQIPRVLASLDLSVVHLRPDPVFRTVIPSKIFESMAVGIPLIHAVEGESAEIVQAAGAGVCLPGGDPERLADTLARWVDAPEKRAAMGARGQEAARHHHNRENQALRMLKILQRP
jgi:glycosyltransferase involved in cell wall biosynthesis